MKKKTKKSSYKNAIAIAVASFASIALISTGLAAFIIVKDANTSAGGSIQVEGVVDSGLKLAINNPEDERNIVFDAAPGDSAGRVILGGTSSGAVLSHVITGTIEIGQNKSIEANAKLEYTFNIKSTDTVPVPKNDEFTTKFLAPDEASLTRVDLADGLVMGVKTNLTITPEQDDQSKGTFTLEVGFKWGSKYAGTNPSIYYDDHAAGKLVSNELVAADLSSVFVVPTTYSFDLALIASANSAK